MRIRWTWRKALIAAVVVVTAVAYWWERTHSDAALIHSVRLGQAREEVVAIMGQPVSVNGQKSFYGSYWEVGQTSLLGKFPCYYVYRACSIVIFFDADDRVEKVWCQFQWIDLPR